MVRSWIIALSFFPFLTFIVSISEGESEKNAVSDPEINPEKKSKTNNTAITKIVLVEKPKKNGLEIITILLIKESNSMYSKIIFYVKKYFAKLQRKVILPKLDKQEVS